MPEDAGDRTFAQFAGYLEKNNKENMEQIREEMRRMMTENVGVFRTEEGLNMAIRALSDFKDRTDRAMLKGSLHMNQELMQRWEIDNLLSVSMVIAQGALRRRESRGGHARIDFPERQRRIQFPHVGHHARFRQYSLRKAARRHERFQGPRGAF